MSRFLFSFVTWVCLSQPFYALRATPKTVLNFGRSVGHREVTQMSCCLFSFVTRACLSQPFYALRATPKTALNFGRLVGHRKVTRTSCCLFSFITRIRPSRPFYALRAPPKTTLNFGQSVGQSVGRSRGSHTNVTLPLQFRHPGPPFPTLPRPAEHPKNGLKFWSVGRLVGRSVGHGEVTQTSRCLFSFVTRARPSRPFYALRATPKRL
jgi:hypothetical protein